MALHWLLCPGPYNIVTFDSSKSGIIKELDYSVIPKQVLVESPGFYNGNFEIRIDKGLGSTVNYKSEIVQDLLHHEKQKNIDPVTQKVFPIYYREDSFIPVRQPTNYVRNILGRFLWKLQQGICPLCSFEKRHNFSAMDIDHIIPLSAGGNNTLLNLEMKCKDHNKQKSARLIDVRDYTLLLNKITGIQLTEKSKFSKIFSPIHQKQVGFPIRVY